MRNLEYYSPERHEPIIVAAALEGIAVEPVIENATRLIGYGETRHGYGPTCILDLIQTEYVMEPHVTWFPWMRSRDKIVNFKWAMDLMIQSHHVLLNVEKKHIEFFEHFVKKGYIRKIGVIEDLPLVEEIHMYQIKRRTTNE